jgi:hypothetical protein
MNSLALALFLQIASPHQTVTIPKAPSTLSVQTPSATPIHTQEIAGVKTKTTPTLSLDSEVIHAEMERDIGGQGEAIGELKSEVSSLEGNREKIDRPDIDDLKLSRTHFEWIVAGMALIVGTIWFLYERYKMIIWNDVIRPRLLRALSPPNDSATHN